MRIIVPDKCNPKQEISPTTVLSRKQEVRVADELPKLKKLNRNDGVITKVEI
jgi:hypothetical protein